MHCAKKRPDHARLAPFTQYDILLSLLTSKVTEYCIRWKIGVEFILEVWEITKSTKSNTAKLFYCPMHVKYNGIHQYKICQSLRKDWFAKLNCHQIFILYIRYFYWEVIKSPNFLPPNVFCEFTKFSCRQSFPPYSSYVPLVFICMCN